jgi:8-oxo-dGTP diphosphatase
LASNESSRREYPDRPLVGVGAAVMKGDMLLLIKRAKEPGKGLWSIPGGLVELGESVRETARRETMEETGIEVEVGELLGVFDSPTYDEKGRLRFHYILIDFSARPVGGSLKGSSEIQDLKWVRTDEIKQYELTSVLGKLLEKMGLAK